LPSVQTAHSRRRPPGGTSAQGVPSRRVARRRLSLLDPEKLDAVRSGAQRMLSGIEASRMCPGLGEGKAAGLVAKGLRPRGRAQGWGGQQSGPGPGAPEVDSSPSREEAPDHGRAAPHAARAHSEAAAPPRQGPPAPVHQVVRVRGCVSPRGRLVHDATVARPRSWRRGSYRRARWRRRGTPSRRWTGGSPSCTRTGGGRERPGRRARACRAWRGTPGSVSESLRDSPSPQPTFREEPADWALRCAHWKVERMDGAAT